MNGDVKSCFTQPWKATAVKMNKPLQKETVRYHLSLQTDARIRCVRVFFNILYMDGPKPLIYAVLCHYAMLCHHILVS